jgi:hypothetical protein
MEGEGDSVDLHSGIGNRCKLLRNAPFLQWVLYD